MAKQTKKKNNGVVYGFLALLVIVFIIVLVFQKCGGKGQDASSGQGVSPVPASSGPQSEATHASLPYYRPELKDRYAAYQEKNTGLPYETAVVHVNIGLDQKPYEFSEPVADPDSMLVLCNKYHYLSAKDVPRDLITVGSANTTGKIVKLQKPAYDAFMEMAAAAKKDGIQLRISTSYRDYAWQKNLYDGYVKRDGVEKADTYSARPGYSEHQTGLAMDMAGDNGNISDFANYKDFDWMTANSYRYGFILRFPEDKVDITGYKYEPWHYRYVGKEIAKQIHDEGITLEEYWAIYLAK